MVHRQHIPIRRQLRAHMILAGLVLGALAVSPVLPTWGA